MRGLANRGPASGGPKTPARETAKPFGQETPPRTDGDGVGLTPSPGDFGADPRGSPEAFDAPCDRRCGQLPVTRGAAGADREPGACSRTSRQEPRRSTCRPWQTTPVGPSTSGARQSPAHRPWSRHRRAWPAGRCPPAAATPYDRRREARLPRSVNRCNNLRWRPPTCSSRKRRRHHRKNTSTPVPRSARATRAPPRRRHGPAPRPAAPRENGSSNWRSIARRSRTRTGNPCTGTDANGLWRQARWQPRSPDAGQRQGAGAPTPPTPTRQARPTASLGSRSPPYETACPTNASWTATRGLASLLR